MATRICAIADGSARASGDVPHGQVESPLAFEDRADGSPTERQLDDILHVAHVQAVARELRAIDRNSQLRLIGLLLDRRVGGAGALP